MNGMMSLFWKNSLLYLIQIKTEAQRVFILKAIRSYYMNKEKNINRNEFKAVKWVRNVRNKMNQKYKGISDNDYIEIINKKAREFENKKKLSKKTKLHPR